MGDGPSTRREPPLRPLLLGMGWFPDQPGGLNRYLRGLHAALEEAGEEPSAVVIGPAPDAPPSVQVVSGGDRSLIARLACHASVTWVAARRSGMVDAHFALYAVVPTLLGATRGRPLVVHFQGPWADESLAVGHGRAAATGKRLIERTVYRRADLLITLSPAFKRVLVEQYGIVPWRIRAIPPGVDLHQFQPGDGREARARLGIPPDAWVAVAVRRLVPRMGLDILLSAWARVVELHPHAALLVCGEGPERPALERQARELGVDGSVRFLGRIDEDGLVAAYRAADVSVVPTASLEGFGLVTLESLACGTPVVVTDVAGLADAPRRLAPDLVVAAGDPSALAGRLASALDGSQPLPASGSCRRFAETYGWGDVARRHIERYRLLSQRPDQRPLRVVYLDHVAELSGGELALLRLLPALKDVDAHVILAEDGPLVGRFLQAGISVEVLRMGQATRELRRDRLRPGSLPVRSVIDTMVYVARLARRLRALRPDIVHTNSLKAALYGGVAARLSGARLVWHLRDRIAPDYLPRPAVRAVRLLAARLPHGVIANSNTTMATIGGQPGGRSQPRAVVASPIDVGALDQAGEQGLSQADAPLRVLMVGRLDRWKGQHVFLEAFARSLAGRRASALVVGAPLFGQEDYATELKELAARLGIDSQVEFMGHCDDVGALLRTCQVLVHASILPEPFGQVCIEGMAAGLAVVAADAGGPAEVITDGVDGMLVAPGDVDRFAAALDCLAGSPERRARLGKAARRTSRSYRPETVAARTMELYRSVMGGGPA